MQLGSFFISRTAVSSFMALYPCQQTVTAVRRLSALAHSTFSCMIEAHKVQIKPSAMHCPVLTNHCHTLRKNLLDFANIQMLV
jgi:hypothetical protein